MGLNLVTISTKFSNASGVTAVRTNIESETESGGYRHVMNGQSKAFPGKDNGTLHIQLIRGEETLTPWKPFSGEETKRNYFIKFRAQKHLKYSLTATKHGWKIKRSNDHSASDPVLISRLSEELNIFPIRLLLLVAAELPWQVLKIGWSFAKLAYKSTVDTAKMVPKSLCPPPSHDKPETTNVTVGDEEE